MDVKITTLLIIILAGCTFSVSAQSSASEYRPSYEQQLEKGIEAFYQSQWKKASSVFQNLQQRQPKNARAYFFDSMIPFWQYYFGGKDPEVAQSFLKESQQALSVSKRSLEANPHDTTMVLMLSGLYGYRSLVAAGQKEYQTAIESGMTGFKYTRQLLALNADDPKALIGKGMFYYMVGSVPSGLKWVTNMAGFSGNMNEGFQALERAATSESYVSNDAKMILAYLYEREERKQMALKHLQDLSERYPQNIIFQYNTARLYEKCGKLSMAKKKYKLVASMESEVLSSLKSKSKYRLESF